MHDVSPFLKFDLSQLLRPNDPDEDDPDEDDQDEDDYLVQDIVRLSKYYSLWLDDDYRFVVVQGVRLPPGYNYSDTDFLIELPADYPSSPPGIGNSRVYTSPHLRFRGQALRDLHSGTPKVSTPGFGPWAWFCYQEIRWDPIRDQLIKFMEMVRADLTDPRIL